MDWRNCLWYKFCACDGLSCCSCVKNNKQPTPEEFNRIYLNYQKGDKRIKKERKVFRRRKRKWAKWEAIALGGTKC